MMAGTDEVEMPAGGDSDKSARSRTKSRSDSMKHFASEALESARQTKSQFVEHAEVELSTLDSARDYVFNSFVGNLPLQLLSHLTIPRMVLFGLVAYSIYFAMFLGFAISGYTQQLKEEFVSLDVDSGVCKEVLKPVTGYFLATSDGHWEGEEKFKYSLAAYEFDFTSLKADNDEFAAEMQKLKTNELTIIGNRQAVSPIHYNMLLWMHFSTYFSVGGKRQAFGFTAEPGDVFNREYQRFLMVGVVNSALDYCVVTPEALDLDRTYGRMSIDYEYSDSADDDTYNNSACVKLLPPADFGYFADFDKDEFGFTMDLVSLTSALSVNLGIVDISHFEETSGSFYVGTYNNGEKHIKLTSLFDPRFPRMQPILCFELLDTKPDDDDTDDDYTDVIPDFDGGTSFVGKCVLRISGVVVIPAFSHYSPECQDCSPTNPSTCDAFDFVSTFLYFPGEDNMVNTIDAFNRYEDSVVLNDLIHAGYSNLFVEIADIADFAFCGGNDCSLITLNSYDDVNEAMSPYFFNLNEGHCSDTTEKESFDNLALSAPTDLVEEYYRCKHTKTSAFFTNMGIANGNMLLFAPLACFFFLLPLIKAYYAYFLHEPIDPAGIVTDEVKDEALKELVSRLLDVTSGKVKASPGSAIGALADDLTMLALKDKEAAQKATAERNVLADSKL